MSRCRWIIDNATGDLVLMDHLLDKTARIPKEILDAEKSELTSINLDSMKNQIEKEYGYRGSES